MKLIVSYYSLAEPYHPIRLNVYYYKIVLGDIYKLIKEFDNKPFRFGELFK